MSIQHIYIIAFLMLAGCFQSCTLEDAPIAPFSAVIGSDEPSDPIRHMSLAQKVGQLLIWDMPHISAMEQLHWAAREGLISGVVWPQMPYDQWQAHSQQLSKQALFPMWSAVRNSTSLHELFSDAQAMPTATAIAAAASDSLEQAWINAFVQACKQYKINMVLGPHLDCPSTGLCWSNVPEVAIAHAQRLMKQLVEARIAGIPQGAGRLLHFDSTATPHHGYWPDIARLYWSGAAGFEMEWPEDIYALPSNFGRQQFESAMQFGGLLVGRVGSEQMLAEHIYAGTDLLLSDNPARDRDLLLQWIQQGRLSEAWLDKKVRRILRAKLWTQTASPQQLAAVHRMLDIPLAERKESKSLHQEAGIMVLPISHRMEDNSGNSELPDRLLPDLTSLAQVTWARSITLLQQGSGQHAVPLSRFDNLVISYTPNSGLKHLATELATRTHGTVLPLSTLLAYQSKPDGMLVVLLLDTADAVLGHQLRALSTQHDLSLLYFGPSQAMQFLPERASILYIPQCNAFTEKASIEILLGQRPARGRLPIAVGNRFPHGLGIETQATRLNYVLPQVVGIDAKALSAIDKLATSLIEARASPGCEVLVAVQGKIIWHKAYGYLTYAQQTSLRTHHLFDLASLTKVAATTLAAMRLYEDGLLQLDQRVQHYLPQTKGTYVGRLPVRRLLNHSSYLQPNMPIGKYIYRVDSLRDQCERWYCRGPDSLHDLQIAPEWFFDSRQQDSILQAVWHLRPYHYRRYQYSDVNFVILQQVIERISSMPLDSFVYRHIYQPLGLWSLTFNPLQSYPAEAIVPSTIDQRWRQCALRGWVHDETAALFGGVAGNAGLFGAALDLAVLGQLLLNGGSYGNVQLFQPQTVRRFTAKSRENHRGLGFDKPLPYGKHRSVARQASMQSFGHTGFTGTMMWIDPEKELVFIFLANRTWPDPYNTRLYRQGWRKRIMEVVYRAIGTRQSPHLSPLASVMAKAH